MSILSLIQSECSLMSHDLQIIFKNHTNFKDSWMQYIYYLQQISIGFGRAINNHFN